MTLLETAKAVAKLLPGEWRIENAQATWEHRIIIQGPGDRMIYVKDFLHNDVRLEISGAYPYALSQYLPYGDDREKTEITVAKTKTPEQIAKAIVSRLLPPYERMLDRCKEGKARADDYQAKKEKIIAMVIKAMPGATRHPHEDKVYWMVPYSGNATCYQDRVQLNISLPPERAAEVLRGLSRQQAVSPDSIGPNGPPKL
jgi:hypothetical protein